MRKRQVVNMALACLGIFSTAWLGVSAVEGFQLEEPNVYEFVGKKLQIHYSTTSFGGEPQLTYIVHNNEPLLFRGDQIRVLLTEIGQLVSVTLEEVPDLRRESLTILIPDINLERGSVLFETEVILTTSLTTIAGPDLVPGQVQSYKMVEVMGKASRVAFLEGESGIFGEVILSPTCPGPQSPGQLCESPFAGATVQVLDAYRLVQASTTTSQDGLFSVEVAPGIYTVHVDTPDRLPACSDVEVRVPAEGSVFASVDCDTGIR